MLVSAAAAAAAAPVAGAAGVAAVVDSAGCWVAASLLGQSREM